MRQGRETRNEGIIFKKQKISGKVYKARMNWNEIERHHLEDFGHIQAEEAENVWHRRQNVRRKMKKIQMRQNNSVKKNS